MFRPKSPRLDGRTVRSLVFVLLSALYFAGCLWYMEQTPADKRSLSAPALLLIYLALCLLSAAVLLLLRRAGRVSAAAAGGAEGILRSMTLDVIAKLYMPVLICDDAGKIIWYNKAFSQLYYTGEALYGRYLDQFCTADVGEILTSDRPDGVEAGIFMSEHDEHPERFFAIKGYRFPAQGKSYVITFWSDRSELKLAYRKIEGESLIVAYIIIDNLEEMLQVAQEKYRIASANIESILRTWAARVKGVLKEYEKDRYMLLFEAKYLDEMVADRFTILDKVREIRIGESAMPVTISIGISNISGTLAEKETASHAALDLALQRGGDQVVYKTKSGVEFYGGKTKSVQKRTKVRARVIANELAMLISRSSNVLIMGHRYADHDAFGSCIGIAKLAMFCGVPPHIAVNRSDFNIQNLLALIMKKPEYSDVFVDSTEAADLIRSDTLLVVCDVCNPAHFEAPELVDNVENIVIIDHHRKTAEFKFATKVAYIEPSASSASELVTEILEQSLPLGALPKEEADLLLAGILLDTNQFTRNTGVRTFSAALYLRGEGANPADVRMLFRTNLDEFMREAKFESNVVIYRDIIAIAMRDGEEASANDRVAAAKAADKLLSVGGVMASFALVRLDDTIHISARSQGDINVQLILEKLEGGGHFDVAGAQIRGSSMVQTLNRLKKAIDDYLQTLI